MAFEAFLAERRPRPRRPRRVGYLLALLAHLGALALAVAAPKRAPRGRPQPRAELDGGARGQAVRLWSASVFAPSLPKDAQALQARASTPERPVAVRSARVRQGRRPALRSPSRPTHAPSAEAVAGAIALAPPPPPELPPEPEPLPQEEPPEHPTPGPALAPPAAPVAQAPPPKPSLEPPYIPAETARGLRIYESFPGIPTALARRGSNYPLVVSICVSKQGSVASASLLSRSEPELDQVVLDAIRTWRYRPFSFDGVALPFCHTIRIVYSIPA
jgi:TonB family protein